MGNFGTYDFEDTLKNDTILERTFTVTKTVEGVTNPVDLSDATIKAFFSSSVHRVKLSSEGETPEIEITDGANGVFKINPFKIDKIGDYEYDIEITFPDGTVRTWIKGSISILQDYSF